MNTERYLDRLQKELKGLPEEDQHALVEEISSHIDEGLSDPDLGETDERPEQLAVKMGSPQEMGRRLNNVHRPRRWQEYLMIVIPQIFILPFITWLLIAIPNAGPTMNPKVDDFFMYFGIRGAILVRVVMVVLGIILYKRRGRLTALMFWLCSLCLDIFRSVHPRKTLDIRRLQPQFRQCDRNNFLERRLYRPANRHTLSSFQEKGAFIFHSGSDPLFNHRQQPDQYRTVIHGWVG